MGAITKTTKRASGSNPVWNEDFEFPLDYCQGQSLTVDVFDSDKLSEDELLGSLDIDLDNIQSETSKELWYDFDKVGKMKIQKTWFPVSTIEGDNNVIKLSKVLSVFVGKIVFEKLNSEEEKQNVSISIDTEKDKKTSKIVQVNIAGEAVINEGFMMMMRNKEQKIIIKIVENTEEVCQKTISIPKFEEGVVHLVSVNSEKVTFPFKISLFDELQ